MMVLVFVVYALLLLVNGSACSAVVSIPTTLSAANDRRILQTQTTATTSSGRVTFGSFDISPFDECNNSNNNNNNSTPYMIAEQVRAAIEDCLRISIVRDCQLSTATYVGLGNAKCTSSSNDATVTIFGGVIDFASTVVTPSLSDTVIHSCLPLAITSNTCIETIQTFFPNIEYLNYRYHSTTSTAPIPVPPDTVPTPTPLYTTESNDIVSTSTSNGSNNTSDSPSTLVIAFAVVGSGTILVAMIGFLFMSRLKHRSQPANQLVTNTNGNTFNDDLEVGCIMSKSNHHHHHRQQKQQHGIIVADDDENTPTTNTSSQEDGSSSSLEDFDDNDTATPAVIAQTVERGVGDAVVYRNSDAAADDNDMGYVSSDSSKSDTDENDNNLEWMGTNSKSCRTTTRQNSFIVPGEEHELEMKEADDEEDVQQHRDTRRMKDPILLVPLLHHYLQNSTDNVEVLNDDDTNDIILNNSIVAPHGIIGSESLSSSSNDEKRLVETAAMVVPNGCNIQVEIEDDFELDRSWDPDDTTVSSVEITDDKMYDDEENFSVTKKSCMVVSPRKKNMEQSKKRNQKMKTRTDDQPQLPFSPPRDNQFRRSRNFVVVLPTTKSPQRTNNSNITKTTPRRTRALSSSSLLLCAMQQPLLYDDDDDDCEMTGHSSRCTSTSIPQLQQHQQHIVEKDTTATITKIQQRRCRSTPRQFLR